MRTHLHNQTVELSMGSNHVYRAKVNGGKSIPVPNVTTIIGVKDKSFPLLKWQMGVIEHVIKGRSEKLIGKLPPAGMSFKLKEEARDLLAEDIREMVKAVRTAPDEVRDKAGDTGTVLHAKICEIWQEFADSGSYSKSGAIIAKSPREIRQPLGKFMSWVIKNEVIPVVWERPVMSLKHWYSGTVDAILRIDGEDQVWDFKTGKKLYNDVLLQLEAYKSAWNEEFPDKKAVIGGALFFERVEDDPETKYLSGDFVPYSFDEDEKHMETFLALRKIYKWDKETWKMFS